MTKSTKNSVHQSMTQSFDAFLRSGYFNSLSGYKKVIERRCWAFEQFLTAEKAGDSLTMGWCLWCLKDQTFYALYDLFSAAKPNMDHMDVVDLVNAKIEKGVLFGSTMGIQSSRLFLGVLGFRESSDLNDPKEVEMIEKYIPIMFGCAVKISVFDLIRVAKPTLNLIRYRDYEYHTKSICEGVNKKYWKRGLTTEKMVEQLLVLKPNY